jgi:hypothetical protein
MIAATLSAHKGRYRMICRSVIHTVSFALCAVVGTAPAVAQDFYKGRTLTIVVGFSTGGGFDVNARLLARHIGRHIPGNPTIIVQNMPGAAGIKSVQYLDAAAPKDGTVINIFNFGSIGDSSSTRPESGSISASSIGSAVSARISRFATCGMRSVQRLSPNSRRAPWSIRGAPLSAVRAT